MNTRAIFGVMLLAGIPGTVLTLPAMARQDALQDMQMPGMQMPAPAPAKEPAKHSRHRRHAVPAPATSTQAMQGMEGMDMSSMPGMQMPEKPAQAAAIQHLHFGNMTGVRPEPGGLAEGSHQTEMSSMPDMDMSSMPGGKAPPDARSPDYSDGYRYTHMPGMDMADHARLGTLMIDQLEYAHDSHGKDSGLLNAETWYGGDFNKLWLKAEGHFGGEFRTEALWSHAVSAYWNTQAGVRQDFGEGPGRTWVAFGVQGLAPFWFDTEAELYLDRNGRTAARVEFEYEELLTQRLVLQPELEVNLYGKEDPERGIGSGLSDSGLGLRLRYEFRREVAPYIGVVWRQRYGRTADFARRQGEHAGELQFVAGLHFWF